MGYYIEIIDPETKETLTVDTPHSIQGSTYAVFGSNELSLTITYNYSPIFCELLGNDGIRSIYGKHVKTTLPILRAAADQLDDSTATSNYWDATEGNAKLALENLIKLGQLGMEGIWHGD